MPPNTTVVGKDLSTLLAVATFNASFSCTARASTPAPTNTPAAVPGTCNATIAYPCSSQDEFIVSTTSAIAAITTTAVAVAALAGSGGAGDAQMLVAVLGSPCMCGEVFAASSPGVLSLALSPLSPLGDAWAVLGNSSIMIAAVVVHCVVVHVAAGGIKQRAPRSGVTSRLLDVGLGVWIDSGRYDLRRLRDAMQLYRFPGLSVRVAVLLLPGVVRGVGLLLGLDVDALSGTAIGVGIVAAFSIALLEVGVYRFVVSRIVLTRPRTDRIEVSFREYSNHAFAPVPPRVASTALPRGTWEPEGARRSLGEMVGSWLPDCMRAWTALLLLNVAVQVLGSVRGGCDAMLGVTAALVVCAGVVLFVVAPHRSRLSSYAAGVGQMVVGVTALLGLLCRHDMVGPGSVAAMGVVGSVVSVVSKAYNLCLPYVEARLLQFKSQWRDSAVEAGVLDAERRPQRGRRKQSTVHLTRPVESIHDGDRNPIPFSIGIECSRWRTTFPNV